MSKHAGAARGLPDRTGHQPLPSARSHHLAGHELLAATLLLRADAAAPIGRLSTGTDPDGAGGRQGTEGTVSNDEWSQADDSDDFSDDPDTLFETGPGIAGGAARAAGGSGAARQSDGDRSTPCDEAPGFRQGVDDAGGSSDKFEAVMDTLAAQVGCCVIAALFGSVGAIVDRSSVG